jgi:hypothetical protein
MLYGYSTGALAKGDFRAALAMIEQCELDAVELSALRIVEMPALLQVLPELGLKRYQHVTVHAPSRFEPEQEARIAEQLGRVADLVSGFIVHAEVIVDPAPWRALGSKVLVENADGRKRTGRTLEEFQCVMDQLPDARVCFDVAHAHQVDSSMLEARRLIRAFRDRIAQLHVSQLNHECQHQALSWGVVRSFHRLASLLPDTTVILESVVPADQITAQVKLAKACFERDETVRAALDQVPASLFG